MSTRSSTASAKCSKPWIDHATAIWAKLKILERGDEPRLTGHGRDTEAGRALGMTCGAFAARYTTTSAGIMGSKNSYVGALEALRDTLRQVVDSYRTNELRQQDSFRGMLRDI